MPSWGSHWGNVPTERKFMVINLWKKRMFLYELGVDLNSNFTFENGDIKLKIRGQPRTSNHKPLKHQPRRTRTILRILRKRTNRLPRMASR